MIDFSKINLPFTVQDLLSSSFGLLGVVGHFVLLGLVILLVPVLKYLITHAVDTYETNKLNEGRPRDQITFFGSVKTDIVENKLYRLQKRFRR